MLNAAVPQGLTSCQTVYWLRSASPFTTTDQAKTYFDTASAPNVLKSSNESSIANGVTGASLNVIPEACTSPKTWYYTPVVVQLMHAADSVSVVSSTDTAFYPFGTQIGSYLTIPDQTTKPTICDLLDTPVTKSLKVTVSNYTGRANMLRIIVFDAISGITLYQSSGYPGNGTYTVPASAIPGDFLQSLQLAVMDYNCTSSFSTTSCTSSQMNMSVSRKVVYGAHAAKVTSNCALASAIRVDFAPSGCTKLAVVPATVISDFSVVPNPAASSVALRFNLSLASLMEWKMSDMAGRVIFSGSGAYGAGAHEATLDLSQYARGIYLINLSDGRGVGKRIKLVLQ
jgi:hypothetical protein